MIQVVPVAADVARPVVALGRREGVSFNARGTYYGIYVDDVLASVAALELRRQLAVFSSDYTRPEFRGRGFHAELLAYRLDRARAFGATQAQAVCLKPSVRNYLKAGFGVVQQYKLGWRVRRALVPATASQSSPPRQSRISP